MTKGNQDSVARGGAAVVFARMMGMLLSFGLFLVVARESPTEAGVLRTVFTYIVIAEWLTLLGMHRWVATEMAPDTERRWPLFTATIAFSLIVSILVTAGYVAIAESSIYSAYLGRALLVGALAVIPTGVYSCVFATLVGIGRNRVVGRLNLIENLVRCSVGLALFYAGYSVVVVVWVFVLSRWMIAIAGFAAVRKELPGGGSWLPRVDLMRLVAAAAPRFALIVLFSLLLRNIGQVALPAIRTEAETALYTVTYQLFDLLLLVPSILTITSNNLFVNKADTSTTALRRASIQLLSITALIFFPIIALTAAFARNILTLLYGDRYLEATPSLVILMMAAALMMIDQVLSQIMLARRDYRSDMISIVIGGSSAVLLALPLAKLQGAAGAALALCLATLVTAAVRLWLMRRIFDLRIVLLAIWRPTFAAAVMLVACVAALRLDTLSSLVDSKLTWIVALPFAVLVYAALVHLSGGTTPVKVHRMKQFLFHH